MEISNQDIKNFAALDRKKERIAQGLFLVEGHKMIEELAKSDYELSHLIGYGEDFEQLSKKWPSQSVAVNQKTMERISNMKNPTKLIAVVHIPESAQFKIGNGPVLMLDDLQDPGNLGTIIRTAHWFGIEHIICSINSVDLYNPKTIQASMGAMFKMKIHYIDLMTGIEELKQSGFRIYGTFMNGNSVYQHTFTQKDVLVLGNEGQGISTQIEALIDQKLSIPNFSKGHLTESLNVATAAAVFCSESAKQLVLK